MKLKLDIKPGTHKKKGLFGKWIDIHVLHIDLELTEEERAIVEKANILTTHIVTTQDWMDPPAQNMIDLCSDTGGRWPIYYNVVVNRSPVEVKYHTYIAARKGMEETKQSMIELKALLEQAGDPSNDSFEL